ncbi:MAG: phosphonate ABC transporter substrate-binding protein [Desulfobulbaceae bacterium]|nr:phosphonate ABC transporter substrate-binding protein [Desulfobulbaceae bacterium]
MRRCIQIITALITCFLALPVLAAVPADWPKTLNFGIIPTESSDNVTERYRGLSQHLEKQLGIPVKMQVATDYAGVITAMQFKHIELAYFGPKSYVDAAQRANAEAFAMQLGPDGNQGYHSVIITRKDSPIQNIEDAKGKVFAFTDPNSTSGTLVPMIYFVKELQVDPEKYFSRVIYAGSHDAAALALLGNRVDAASTNDLNLMRGNGKNWNTDKDFRIIWQSELIPNSPLAFRKDLPESLKEALKKAITSFIDPESLKQLKAGGYIPVADAAYDPIRDQIEVEKQLRAR